MKTFLLSFILTALCISTKAQITPSTAIDAAAIACGCSTTGWAPTLSYIGDTKANVRCGHQFAVKKAQSVKLVGTFTCSGGCAPKYILILKKADGTILQNTSSPTFEWGYVFPDYGGYRLEVTPICNGNKCTTCTFYFTMNPSTPPAQTSCEPEDCIRFKTNNVTYAPYGTAGQYRMLEGTMAMVLFPNKEESVRAVEIVKHYGMNSQCFVGRPNPSFSYWLSNGVAPTGSLPNEDCLNFNPNTIEVKQVNGTWKIVDGDHWMFDFGANEAEARQSFCLIKKYGFTKTCYVGRPNPSMTYLKK